MVKISFHISFSKTYLCINPIAEPMTNLPRNIAMVQVVEGEEGLKLLGAIVVRIQIDSGSS